MNLKELMDLFHQAKDISYSLRLTLVDGKNLLLNPDLGELSSRNIGGKDYIVLTRSLLPVDSIQSAFFYKGGKNNEY